LIRGFRFCYTLLRDGSNRPTQGAKIMLSCLWHVSFILASLWGPSEFLDTVIPQFLPDNTEKGALAGAAVGAGAGALVTRGNPVEQPASGPFGGAVGADQDRRDERKAAVLAAVNAQPARQMTLEEIVQMAQVGQKDAVIIGQINNTGSVFQLTADDLNYLHQQRVSDTVINYTQSRRLVAVPPVCIYPAPPPNAIHVSEFGPPILNRIPYVNRLFRTVGYSLGEGVPYERIGVDFNVIVPGQLPSGDIPPSRAEILRALPPASPGIPYVYDEYRDNFQITYEKIADRIDAPVFVPLVGPAQVHHGHWKCYVYFTQTIEVAYPVPFKVAKKRAAVVYIDKDRLHLCAGQPQSEQASAPLSCPLGGRATPKIVAKAERGQQIQFDITVAVLNRTALPNFKFRWAENQSSPVAFGVLSGPDGIADTIDALREAGLAKIVTQPRVVTLSGRRARVSTGGQIPVTSSGPNPTVTYKLVGTTIELLPTLKANGKIALEVRYEGTSLNRSKDVTIPGATPTIIPGFDTRCAQVVARLEPGKTLVIGGLTQNEKSVTMTRIPFLSELPGFGDLFVFRDEAATRQETIIIITPHIVTRGDSSETCEPPIVTPAKAERGNRLTLEDVIALSKSRLSPRIVIRQMEITNAVFDLTVHDLIRLAENGVDEEIISAMQERH
jgi:Bacterial type II and III secretion system protein